MLINNLHFGFIGGCINTQKEISSKERYYHLFSNMLTQSEPGINIKISLGNYLSYDQVVSASRQFIEHKQPDIIVLFIRPFPIFPLLKPVIKYDKANKQRAYCIHPEIIFRRLRWHEKISVYQEATGNRAQNKKRFGLSDINMLFGLSIGLQHWTDKYLNSRVQKIHSLCVENKKQLIVISPPRSSHSILSNFILRKTTYSLQNYCADHQILFMNIFNMPICNYANDLIHLNHSGHKKLANDLFEFLMGSEILENKKSSGR